MRQDFEGISAVSYCHSVMRKRHRKTIYVRKYTYVVDADTFPTHLAYAYLSVISVMT